MNILESLFKPTLKDLRAGLNQRRIQEYGTNTAASPLFDFPASPGDVVRLIHGVSLSCTGGGGLGVPSQLYFGVIQNGSQKWFLKATPQIVIAAGGTFTWVWLDVGFLMFQGDQPRAQATFSTTNAGDTMEAMYWGYEIPRGNLNA